MAEPVVPVVPNIIDEQTKRAGMKSAEVLAAEVAKKQAEDKIKALLAAKGIGAALLFDPKYGKPNQKGGLWEVYQAYLTGNEALALDILNGTEWMQLDSTEQNKYFKRLTKTDAYKNDLNSFLVRIKKSLAAKGITPPDDKTLEDKYYLAGVEDNVILDELSGKITAKGAAGEAADALSKLRTVAFNNGFNLDKDFAGQIDDWLQRIAKGESINDFARLIRAQAKLGLPEKIGTYLDQGLDLANVYAPYRSAMASILELTPDSIKLDDPTLQQAYAGDKEMSLFDFKRALRRDPRWQYTDNARQDVSTTTLQILRDFGFQG
jgi:hypothetical protein